MGRMNPNRMRISWRCNENENQNERPVQRCIGLLAYYDVMCQGNRFLTHMLLNKEIAQNEGKGAEKSKNWH